MELGIHLSAEEHPPQRPIETGRRPEEAGLGFATISGPLPPVDREAGPEPVRVEEATGVIRRLFAGDRVAHDGRHFHVEDARLYTLPDDPVPIQFAASGTTATAVAGRVADGLIIDSPDPEVIDRFRERRSDDGRPVTGNLMCVGATT